MYPGLSVGRFADKRIQPYYYPQGYLVNYADCQWKRMKGQRRE